MRHGVRIVAFAALVFFISSPAWARQVTSSIAGVVKDSAGGVVPGATVVVTNPDTGAKFEALTSSTGTFNVPALQTGRYTVTVSLQGFKTTVLSDVRVQAGIPANVTATLEVGGLQETVNVKSEATELINTRTATVTSTLNSDQIAQLPTPTRDLLLGGVTFLVGVNFTGAARGNATVNGLPESFLNITLDGVSNNDNFNKSTDGFFAPVRPRQDAIEAVTVTTAAGGADVGGHGAVSINFTTRSGTNRFTGSAYEYYRDTWMNTNYWFNKNVGNPRNDVQLNQFGARVGGPIVIPGVYDGSGKAFYFFHYEQLRLPNNASRTRTVLQPAALNGSFKYNVTVNGQVVVREVNVLQIAANANSQFRAIDPTVLRTLNNIMASTAKTGVLSAQTDPLFYNYDWLTPAMQIEHQPALRLDYNFGSKHRFSFTFNKLYQDRNPDQLNTGDQRFPDAPNFTHTVARRPSRSLTLRSTLNTSMVNEFRVGITAGESILFGQPDSGGPPTFADQDNYALTLGLSTNWHTTNNLSGRSAWQYSFDDSLNWQKSQHTLTIGGQIYLGRFWNDAQQQVPGITFGMNQADPDFNIFSNSASGTVPDASNGQLGNARALYALLTGRVASVTGQAALDDNNKYVFLGKRRQEGALNNYATYVQDSWRVSPTVTLNAGLRWDVQTPFSAANDNFSAVTMADLCGVSGPGDGSIYNACKFFTPGASGGKNPEYSQLKSGTNGYNTDWNNFAPNVGVAWRPNVQSGFMRTFLGDPEQATLRGGYSVQYERQGFGAFTGIYGGNPGATISLTRNASTGLVNPGETWPILLSQRDRLYPAPFPESPTYPIQLRANRADSLNGFHPDIEIASARTWTVGFQRSITKDMAMEVRYVGTRGVNQWSTLNYNERNLIENGFYDEFLKARTNLQAHVAAGCGTTGQPACSFAYRGPGTGTQPLPIYLAYLSGRPAADANTAANYTGTDWTNTALTADMGRFNPSPSGSAADLDGDVTRRNRATSTAVGLPANFFVLNPVASGVNVQDSGAFSDYHALQLELRRRLSKGLTVNANYQYAREGGSSFLGFHYGRAMDPVDNVRHAIKAQWDWTIPVGRGQRYGTDLNPWLNGVLGGWQFSGATRMQARMMDMGGVRLVGMTVKELEDLYDFRIINDPVNPGRKLVTMLPDDIILNTQRAFNTSATSPTGYGGLGVPEGRYIAPANSENCIELKAGDCTPRTLLVRAPWFFRVDIGMTKRFALKGATNFELRVDVLNLFDNVNFNPVSNPGGGATIFQVGSAYRDADNNFDPGGRLGQLSFRINW
jgi:hypothetical protein